MLRACAASRPSLFPLNRTIALTPSASSIHHYRYTYDILLEPSVKLEPADGEAESFELMGVDEIMERMRNGEFKPNCALGT